MDREAKMSNILTKEQVCQRYGISVHTLYQWTSHNKIPYLKISGKIMFREQDLSEWEDKQLVGLPKTKLL